MLEWRQGTLIIARLLREGKISQAQEYVDAQAQSSLRSYGELSEKPFTSKRLLTVSRHAAQDAYTYATQYNAKILEASPGQGSSPQSNESLRLAIERLQTSR